MASETAGCQNTALHKQVEKRNLVSSFFVTLLIGIAYERMISAINATIENDVISFADFCMAASFFFVSLRFFIGNQLHLLSDDFVKLPGNVWLYDLVMIIIQCIVLIFVGSTCTGISNQKFDFVGFVDFMIILFVIDILWIGSQFVFGKIVDSWKRNFIPWPWALLNTILVISMLVLGFIFDDLYSTTALAWVFGFSLIGFVVDVVLLDLYGAH